MKTACIDCQQKLSEVFRNTPGDEVPLENLTAELQQHLAHCSACREEWAFLKTVRNEMRTLPQLDAPPELRGRIFQQLKDAPQAAPAEQSTWSAPSAWKQRRERFSWLFRNPFAIAWASGVAVAVFGFITLLQPYSETEVLLPERGDTSTIPKTASEEPKQFVQEKQETREALPSTSVVIPRAQKETSESGPQKTPARTLKPSRPAPTPKLQKPAPSPSQKRNAPPLKPAAPQQKTATTQSLPPQPLPEEEKTPLKKQEKNKQEKKGKQPVSSPDSLAIERSSQTETEPEMRSPAKGYLPETEAASSEAAPLQRSGPSGPSGPSSSSPQSATLMRRRATSPQEKERKMELLAAPALFSQKVQAELSSPENMQRAQITAILPEKMRLKPDKSPPVLWQGAAVKGEKLQLDFEVEAAPGTYAIELVLQEIQDDTLKTLASRTVTVIVSGQSNHTK